MENIFPPNFVSGSVRSQEELDAAFLKYPNISKDYIQTALYWEDTRKWYEDHWPKVCKYLDKDFLQRFQMEEEHNARAWEFHVAAVFSDKGLKMEEKIWEYGPDFCIKMPDSDKKLWIEAITCDLGKSDPVEPYPDLQPGKIYSFTGNIEDINRPRALRITSAIGTKLEKFKEYVKESHRSGVTTNDYLLIAVNGMAIQHNSDPSILFKYAVFGQGPDMYVKAPGKEKLEGPFYKPVIKIIKKVGVDNREIPTNFMEMSDFSKISAVLYCGNKISHSWNNNYDPGDDFLFAYHSNPENSIADDIFKFGLAIRKNSQTSIITVKKQ